MLEENTDEEGEEAQINSVMLYTFITIEPKYQKLKPKYFFSTMFSDTTRVPAGQDKIGHDF